MTKSIPTPIKGLFVALLLLLGLSDLSVASHLVGGNITYISLGGLQYRVTLTLFRDCSGINLINESLYVSEGRCGNIATGVIGAGSAGPVRRDTQQIFTSGYPQRYRCTAAINPAYPNVTANGEAVYYNFTVTLPSRKRNWCFFWTNGARPEIVNLGTGSTGTSYIDATLNNLDFNVNTSPQFNTIGYFLPPVCFNQDNSINTTAFDPDGDSLVYSLVAPRVICDSLTTYTNYHGQTLLDSTGGTLVTANVPSGSFNANFPVTSFLVDRQTGTGVPYFQFNPSNGVMSFKPTQYTIPTNTADGVNKYAIAVRVTEYRRDLFGVWTMIGETNREFIVTVIDCGSNRNPSLDFLGAKANNLGCQVTREDSGSITIKLNPCQTPTIRIPFKDPNPSNSVFVGVDNNALPGSLGSALVTQTGSASSELQINLNSAPIGWRASTHYIPLRVYNNVAPLVGANFYTIKLVLEDQNLNYAATGTLGNTLEATIIPGAQYQWYLNGTIIPGATNSTYVRTQPGSYSVRVTDGNCVKFAYYPGPTSLDSPAQLLSQITLYPNPASQLTKIKAPAEIWTKVQSVEVVNALGQVVLSQPAQQDADGQMTLPLTGLKSGHYWLRFGGLGVGKVLVVE